jgi:signal transduction histidine kinase
MEAIFIGFLCYFDESVHSPFRFYYFLSLLVCAMRHSPWITYTTFSLHAISYTALVFAGLPLQRSELTSFFLTQIFMIWVTWASTELASLVNLATRRLSELNDELKENQASLEERIAERTLELQESQAMLVQQEKQAAFGLLAAGIAHEVGNPLAAISSLVQMLNRKQIDDYTREQLHLVDDQLRRIQSTLRELLDFSRPANTEKTLCDVHEMIDSALNIAKYYKRKKGKQIVTEYDKSLPQLRIVRDQLVQVFLNLILNALDATEEGATIRIVTGPNSPDSLFVRIEDQGHGIEPQHTQRLFQPYFTTKTTGTGLGLFVCRNIVREACGGQLELIETSPSGTIFQVTLPLSNDALEDHHSTVANSASLSETSSPSTSAQTP